MRQEKRKEMPFSYPFPRSFTPSSVLENAPALSGVYGVSNATCWVYIGETDNIQAALLHLLEEPVATVPDRRPTGFVFEVCDRLQRLARQGRLVREYEPVCNRLGSRKQ